MKFYALRSPGYDASDPAYGDPSWDNRYLPAEWVDEQIDLGSIICPVYPGHQRPDVAGRSDLVIRLNPKRIGDFMWTWYSDPLITDRVLRLFQQGGFTGFSVRPVTIVGSLTKTPVPADLVLWELVVTGQAGHADARSGMRRVLKCEYCGLELYSSYQHGIAVDEAQWDGSDLCSVIEHPQRILVTERVKDLIVVERLTNVFLIPSEEMRWSKSVVTPEEVYGT